MQTIFSLRIRLLNKKENFLNLKLKEGNLQLLFLKQIYEEIKKKVFMVGQF